jgi:hypothetical protein
MFYQGEKMHTRLEKDSLGERAIPADAYYGVQTDRAIENLNPNLPILKRPCTSKKPLLEFIEI